MKPQQTTPDAPAPPTLNPGGDKLGNLIGGGATALSALGAFICWLIGGDVVRAFFLARWAELSAGLVCLVLVLVGMVSRRVRRPVLIVTAVSAALVGGACVTGWLDGSTLRRWFEGNLAATVAGAIGVVGFGILVLLECPRAVRWVAVAVVLAGVAIGGAVLARKQALVAQTGANSDQAPDPSSTRPVSPVDRPNSVGMQFVWVDSPPEPPLPPGMKPFLYQTTPVTQAQLRSVLPSHRPPHFGRNGGGWKAINGADTSDWPAEMVSFEEAKQFANVLSNLAAEQAAGVRYRLPTEAEFAAARRSIPKPEPGDARLKWGHDTGRTGPVTEFGPRFGLYGLVGNVREWVTGGDCGQGEAIALGGSYSTPPDEVYLQQPVKHPRRNCPVTFHATKRYSDIGFRLVCEARASAADSSEK